MAGRRAHAAGLVLVALVTLIAPGKARAHLNVEPRLVEQGRATDFTIELPRLRPGGAPIRLVLDGAGVTAGDARLSRRFNGETVWNVRATVDAVPGRAILVLRAEFGDGESVDVDQALTVVPADAEEGLPVAAIIVGAGIAFGLAAATLLVAGPGRMGRRRSSRRSDFDAP